MRGRSIKDIFDLVFLLIHIGKWVVGLCLGIGLYQVVPAVFWVFVFLILSNIVIRDLYRVFKAIIKDTTIDNLESEGDFSYVKGIDPKDLTAAKTQILVYLAIITFGVVGIVNNVNAWKEDGQNRVGNIAISSLLAFGPVFVVVSQARKKD